MNHSACTRAYWHHPLFSSGQHGNTSSTRALFKALYQAGADVVVNGHDHDNNARFPPPAESRQLRLGRPFAAAL